MKNKKLFAILTLVCFMFTLMPVAAFAATDAQQSYIYAEDTDVDVDEATELTISLNEAGAEKVYVWFEEKTNVPSTALVGEVDEDGNALSTPNVAKNGVLTIDMNGAKTKTVYVTFSRDGEYELHASIDADPLAKYNDENSTDTKAESVAAIADSELITESASDVVTVSADAAKTNKYVIKLDNATPVATGEATTIKDGKATTLTMQDKDANGIDEVKVKFTVYKNENSTETVYAKDVEIDTTSGIDVNDLTVKRDGTVSFDVTVNKAGMHKIYVTIGDFDATLKINAQDGEAEEITLDYVAKTPVNLKEAQASLESYVRFIITDANGNELGENAVGVTNAQKANKNYVTLTDKPADSKLKSSNISLKYNDEKEAWTITTSKIWDEEGTYSFKVALDDGTYATASITFKEADDPVSLNINYEADSVQLGGSIAPKSISRMDANYVASTVYSTRGGFVDGVEFVVTGTAVEKVEGATIYVKDDEKYVGSTIKVTVIDNDNNLVATKTLTVADEANELVFDTTAAPVDSTKKVTVTLVDENGKSVALPNATSAQAYVVVLDKPAGADATAEISGAIKAAKGQFAFNFSADKVGTYEVQAVLQVKVDNAWRYYTGTQEIKVGATGIEDTVVMSIGSSKIVVNDKVIVIDAAPMIKDSRTFVPFRALAEAFGATVAYDEATQSVTAELDGTTVVMTIGSATYTVNGVAHTADVAPFINGSRTMVPVRFVAEAFGINVTAIAAEDGSVADVLFTK